MADLKIGRLMMGICQTNCYFVYQEGKSEVIFIDPADKGGYIYDALQERGFTVAGILLTHGHFDHIGAARELADTYGILIGAGSGEADVLRDTEKNLSGQFGEPFTVQPDKLYIDKEEFMMAGFRIQVLHTPGHTKGGVCYYFPDEAALFSGDTLFCEGVGRTDFPTGSMSVLVNSVRGLFAILPENTIVYPGHGCETTIAHEKENNPFV